LASCDGWTTAAALSAAVKKIGQYDLILCGRESSDNNAGQTGPAIASILGVPCITLARKIEVNGNTLTVERVTSSGYEKVESPLPAVVTVSNEIGEARYPTIKGIMAAKRVQPVVWKPADLGLTIGPETGRMKIQKLFQPVHEGKCDFAQGDTPEEQAANLAVMLRGSKVI
jgi:electron transfer flavoprotein beta subunit